MARKSAKSSSYKATPPASVPVPQKFQAPPPPKTSRKPTVSKEMLAKRAYEIWVAKGRPVGQDLENWQQAERELFS